MSAGISSALPVGMSGFQALLRSVSPNITVCVRGRHAVGKSEVVHQSAKAVFSDFYKDAKNQAKFGWKFDDGLPVVERRLSQMTEGDIIGLPFLRGEDRVDATTGERLSYSCTEFKPCDWLIQACEQPVLLFLDERNRALEGVKQAVFQLCDSKAFYGYVLHPDTRIVIAENIGDEYQIQACDPAEISRCAIVTLEPSTKDWLDYATGKCHEATIEYIRQNESKLEHTGAFEPNKKYPDRRSWFKVDAELQRLGLFDDTQNTIFRILAGSMLGAEVGPAFHAFCKERDRQVSAKDILKSWAKAKTRLAVNEHVTNEQYVESVAKVADLLKKHKLSDDEAQEVGKFMHDCPAEVRMTAWSAFQKDRANLFKVHPYIEKLMLKTARFEETGTLQKSDGAATDPAATGTPPASAVAAVPAPKTRGGRKA